MDPEDIATEQVDTDVIDDGSTTETIDASIPDAEADLAAAFDEDDDDDTPVVVDDDTDQPTAEETAAAEADEAKKVDTEAKTEAKKADPEPKKETPAPKAEPTAEETAAAQQAAQAASSQDREQFVTSMIDALKDLEIGDGGTDEAPMPKTMGEFIEMFPEIGNVTKAMIAHLREELIGEVRPIRQSIESQAQQAATQAIFTALEDSHPDAKTLIDSQEFQTWGDGKSIVYQAYMASAVTAEDIAPILALYKAEAGIETAAPAAKSRAATIADKQRAAKKITDDLGNATTRAKRTVKASASAASNEQQLKDAWDEDDD